MAYVFDEIDDIYWAWERLYNNVLDDHAPIKYKSRRAWWIKIHHTRDKMTMMIIIIIIIIIIIVIYQFILRIFTYSDQ